MKKIKYKNAKKPKADYILARDLTEQDMKKAQELMEQGNIPAIFEIIMHNQLHLNYKLSLVLQELDPYEHMNKPPQNKDWIDVTC